MTAPVALVAAPTLPEYDREGGSRDIADLVDFLLDEGWRVAFLASEGHARSRHGRRLVQRGVELHTRAVDGALSLPEMAAPDVAIIAFWHLAEELIPLVRRQWPSTRVVVSSIDLHFLRRSRRIFASVAKGDRSFLLDGYFGDETVREINTYAAADGVLAVSEKEADLINDLVGDAGLASCVPVTQGEQLSPFGFDQRRGVLFVGNFRHEPNVEAVEHLCHEIVPLIDPSLLRAHPVQVVGNAPNDTVIEVTAATPGVELIGWVPSLTPYLHRARVCVAPLLHGAGVKGKLVRALAAGTPTVATTIGVEGLGLTHGTDVLVADDPGAFADAVSSLLVDAPRWTALAHAGHGHIAAVHGDDVVRGRLLSAIERARSRPAKPAELAAQLDASRPATRYGELVRKLAAVVPRVAPPGSRVLVVSKGDDELVALPGVAGEHFPQSADGGHLGWHPPDGADVCRRLDEERAKGPHHLVLPHTAAWWLDHYDGLRAHLAEHYRLVLTEDETCIVWEWPGTDPATTTTQPALAPTDLPVAEDDRPGVVARAPFPGRLEVLLLGVYMAARPNHAADVATVAGDSAHTVEQRWVALGADAPSPALASVTVASVTAPAPKFVLLNRLLAAEDLTRYDHVVVVDDDIAVPHAFLDELLAWQRHLGFALAQPARTARSYIDHRIVQQQPGAVARRTRFVEIGPVFSVARQAYPHVFPFDERSPMGWGYENVWAHRLEEHGLTMGVIDAVPIAHTLRPPVANYSWDTAASQRTALLAGEPHLSLEACFRVLDVYSEAR